MFAPHLRHAGGVDQINLYAQRVAAPVNASRQHGANVEVVGDSSRVGLATFVGKHHAARDDAQFWKLREIVDQAFGDFIAEVLSIGIGSFIDKRENGYGFYGRAAVDGFGGAVEISNSRRR